MGFLAIRKDYLLSEAFELVGKHVYGDEWTGREYCQGKVSSPDEIRNMREPHEHELREIEDQITNLNDDIAKTTNTKRTGTLRKRKAALEDKRERLHGALYQMPLCNEFTAASFHAYERKRKVEQMIVDALRDGKLQVHNGRGEPIQSLVWSGSPGFGYCFELSVARMPRSASPPRRRDHVQITEKSFERWIDTISILTPSAESRLSPQEQCERWLRRTFDDLSDFDTPRKADLLQEAKRKIPGLTGRVFDSVWRNADVPKRIRQAGRRKKSSRP